MASIPPSPPLNLLAEVARQHPAEEIKADFRNAEVFMTKRFAFKKSCTENLFSGTQICIAEFLIQQGQYFAAIQVISRARNLAAAAIDGRATVLNCDHLTQIIQQKLVAKATL